MSNGQIWVGSIPPMAQSSLNLLYLRLTILGLHVPRLAELPCKEIVEGSIPFGSTKIQFSWASNSDGLEYLADTEEVGGSNPSLPTKQVKLS